MRLIYAPTVKDDLLQVETRKEQAFLVTVTSVLKAAQYPNGIFNNIKVDSTPWRELQRKGYDVYRIKAVDPPSIYRIIYMVDEPHDVVYVMNIQHKRVDYHNEREIIAICLDYYNSNRWEDA